MALLNLPVKDVFHQWRIKGGFETIQYFELPDFYPKLMKSWIFRVLNSGSFWGFLHCAPTKALPRANVIAALNTFSKTVSCPKKISGCITVPDIGKIKLLWKQQFLPVFVWQSDRRVAISLTLLGDQSFYRIYRIAGYNKNGSLLNNGGINTLCTLLVFYMYIRILLYIFTIHYYIYMYRYIYIYIYIYILYTQLKWCIIVPSYIACISLL